MKILFECDTPGCLNMIQIEVSVGFPGIFKEVPCTNCNTIFFVRGEVLREMPPEAPADSVRYWEQESEEDSPGTVPSGCQKLAGQDKEEEKPSSVDSVEE